MKITPKYLIGIVLLLGFAFSSKGQDTATVFGKVTDAVSLEPIEFATVFTEDGNYVTETDLRGRYRLEIPAGKGHRIVFRRIGYREISYTLSALKPGSQRLININLASEEMDLEVTVRSSRVEDRGMIRERAEDLKMLPSASGSLESLLPSIALGTYGGTGGELSSQYNVRGGNYDENLVYVNDFLIYRPQLISSSQQEGLSFPNINLISSLAFSSGGFRPSYGDKLSSVLDVKYKRPDRLAGSVELSMLGGSVHIEGKGSEIGFKNDRFRFLVGARYRSNGYLLSTLDTEGEFNTDFFDLQAYLTYDIHEDWQLGVLGNFNQSIYRLVPESRSTAFGLVDFALELNSVFEGQERDDFTTSLGGIHLTYLPKRDQNPLFLKFISSVTTLDENERFDIIGAYRLSQIETNLGSDDFSQEVAVLGSGLQQSYTRNFLDGTIFNFQHKGGIEYNSLDNSGNPVSNFLEWGATFQREWIDDYINEWERLDSAGYSIPYSSSAVLLDRVLRSENQLESNRYSGFIQNTYSKSVPDNYELSVTGGVRFTYWDLNNEFNISPRVQTLYKPLGWKRDFSFKLATGIYQQPGFYRELRRPDGTVNTDLSAQKSFHVVGGFTYDFRLGKKQPKDFRFIAEAYYKKLWDLVSYEVENVKIRYSGENDATGYVVGLDMRLNGEFLPGAESWINLSILRAREALDGVQHLERELGEEEAKEVKDVPRPTDQLVNMAILFQDYLPQNDNFQVHLNLNFGTGLPFGLRGNNEVFRNTYRFSPYYRVDIGFSAQLWDKEKLAEKPDHFLKFVQRMWVSLEVFNLLGVRNEVSNTWIKTVFNQQYAIPNYLTNRRINLRLRMDF